MKIAVIFENFGPYHVARLNKLAEKCEVFGIEFKSSSSVYSWTPPGGECFEKVTLIDTHEEMNSRELLGKSELLVDAALKLIKPDVLAVPGWGSQHSIAAFRWARVNSVPVIVMSDSQEIDFPRTFIKEWIKHRYLLNCQACLVAGAPHREYLLKLGMPVDRIETGYDVIDNWYFEMGAKLARDNCDTLRQSHRLPLHYFLACGRFVEKKNFVGLIRSYANYRAQAVLAAPTKKPLDLVIVGDGELKGELEQLIEELSVSSSVRLPGFIQYSDMPVFYGLASAFILPSTTEQWGLVVNEAMASGLPVIVSERCGCARDLVQPGINGYIVDPFDSTALTSCMLKMASGDLDTIAMGGASSSLISSWTLERFASNLFVLAVNALERSVPALSLLDRLLLNVLIRFGVSK